MTRRIVSIFILIALLIAPFIVRAAGAAGFAGTSTGNEADIIQIGDWTIYNADHGDGVFSIVGSKSGATPVELFSEGGSLYPAGDSFIYYGTAEDGKQRWQLRDPDEEKPSVLPLTWAESMIAADETTIWYYKTGDGPNRTVYQVGKDGKGKKKLGTLQGTVIGRMDDGSILTCFYARNQVRLWSNGKYQELYKAPNDVEITSCYTDGSHILLQQDNDLGLLRDGAFTPLFSEHVCGAASARNQFVLVSFLGEDLYTAGECSVRLVDFTKPGIAHMGTIPAAPAINFRIESDAVTVYSGGTSTRFEYPETFEPF